MCLTNMPDCCRDVSDSGKWISPNLTDVNSMSTVPVNQVYGNSVILLQRQSEAQLVHGIYRCDIMDNNKKEQHLYVGIYQKIPTCISIDYTMY